jgi:hypothetical protein
MPCKADIHTMAKLTVRQPVRVCYDGIEYVVHLSILLEIRLGLYERIIMRQWRNDMFRNITMSRNPGF